MESTPHLTPVRPVAPVAPYVGGKRNLARRVIERLGAIPHQTYVEPFVGMGGIFLRRPFKACTEVINDISLDVATLFRILQRHYQAFVDMLRWQITGRQEFERLLAATPDTLTDLERAARFLYLQRTAYGGKVVSQNFGVSLDGRGGRFNVTRLGPILEEVHDRLAGVIVERLPWPALLPRYDRANTLFYLDPPYYGCEEDYGTGVFTRDDFARLADALRGLTGRFLMSLNDTPEVRTIFKGFQIEAVSVNYSLSGKPTRASELLISNAPRG